MGYFSLGDQMRLRSIQLERMVCWVELWHMPQAKLRKCCSLRRLMEVAEFEMQISSRLMQEDIIYTSAWIIRIQWNTYALQSLLFFSLRGDLSSGWSLVRVVFHQGGRSWEWSLIRVVFYQGGLSWKWSLIRVVFYQGSLSWERSLIRVVFHQDGLSW